MSRISLKTHQLWKVRIKLMKANRPSQKMRTRMIQLSKMLINRTVRLNHRRRLKMIRLRKFKILRTKMIKIRKVQITKIQSKMLLTQWSKTKTKKMLMSRIKQQQQTQSRLIIQILKLIVKQRQQIQFRLIIQILTLMVKRRQQIQFRVAIWILRLIFKPQLTQSRLILLIQIKLTTKAHKFQQILKIRIKANNNKAQNNSRINQMTPKY